MPDYPFMDPSLPTQERVNDLVSRSCPESGELGHEKGSCERRLPTAPRAVFKASRFAAIASFCES